ncbi:MAG TPA: urease accessory protein UreD [Nitrososphaeraceae archaeon]|nr:urease accessory protein UreD [Nitrososphaeraceae archaeon]
MIRLHASKKNKVEPCSVGKKGLLQLELAANKQSSCFITNSFNTPSGEYIPLSCYSKTFIKNLLTKPPLLVQRALYPNTDFPTMAHIYIMSSAGGILEGDNLKIEIAVGNNTSSHITTQSATKIYKMQGGYASQEVDIVVGDYSYLEFMPREIIPYKSSRFFQKLNLKIGSMSTVLSSEVVTAGRVASGEIFEFDSCYLRTFCVDEKNNIIFLDPINVEPAHYSREELCRLFGNKTILSTTYVITKLITYDTLENEITKIIHYFRPPYCGYSALPHEGGAVVKMVSNSIDDIRILNISIADSVRSLIS